MGKELSTSEAKFIKLQFGLKARLALYKKISAFLEEGIPIHEVLVALAGQYEKNKKGDIRAKVLYDLSGKIESGIRFSDALSYWAPASEVMIIRAGEKGGDMTGAFANAIYATTAASRMKTAITSELRYPGMLIIVLALLVYAFSTQAVPQLTSVLEPEKWPAVSQKLYHLSKFVETKWFYILACVIGVVSSAVYSLSRFTLPIRKYMDYLPPWSIYKAFQSSVFLISVSSMMKTGTPIFETISELNKMSPKYVQKELDKMLESLNRGVKVGESLNQGFLTKDTGIDVEVYGNLSNIQESLQRIGSDAIEAGIEDIKGSVGIIRNIVLLGVTGYIAWIYYAFYTLSKAIGEMASMSM